MRDHGGTTLALIGALALACASPAPAGSEKLAPSLAKYVLSAVPADVPNPTFVDFGGKVHLVGWEVSPKNVVSPGGTLTLKLYWRSVSKVSRGFHLATRLTARDGKVYEFDNVGPLRETVSDSELGSVSRLPPSAWVPGMVYVDEQSLTVPDDVDTTELALSVGVVSSLYQPDGGSLEKLGDFGLKVLSGISDGKEAAVLARFDVPARSKSGRGRPGGRPGTDRRPGAVPLGRLPLGRPPGLDKEKAP